LIREGKALVVLVISFFYNAAVIHLFSSIGVDPDITDLNLVYHFCRYYKDLDLDDYHIVLQTASQNRQRLDHAREAVKDSGLKVSQVWMGGYSSHEVHRRLLAVLSSLGPEDWMIPADVDEFIDFPDPPQKFLKGCSRRGHNAVKGILIDRVAKGGILNPVIKTMALSIQFPLAANLTKTVAQGNIGKIIAFQAPLIPGRGHHAIIRAVRKARYHDRILEVNHYKWDSLLLARMKKRIEDYKNKRVPWVNESERLVLYFTKNSFVRKEDISLQSENINVSNEV
jgi:hypothetical protein